MSRVYFELLCNIINHDNIAFRYQKLLRYLHERPFVYSIPNDINRAVDGLELRQQLLLGKMSDEGCSVLEMMIALADRCETHIMHDDEYGNRTHVWFWDMVMNLGLIKETDDTYNHIHVERCVTKFLNRDFKRNGSGSLFKTRRKDIDMREIEIWYQMSLYLEDY